MRKKVRVNAFYVRRVPDTWPHAELNARMRDEILVLRNELWHILIEFEKDIDLRAKKTVCMTHGATLGSNAWREYGLVLLI